MSTEDKKKFNAADLPFTFLLWLLGLSFGGGILYLIYSYFTT